MKNKYIYLALVCGLSLAACDDFLDEVPDNRAEIDTEEKVTKLLVSAYPDNCEYLMVEIASDNAMDNGATYDVPDKVYDYSYRWIDIVDDGNDSPKSLWDECYGAIASANQALQAIEDLGNPASLDGQKGEALICRAFNHFILANVFCMAYDPTTAESDLGLPYAIAPETKVKPTYVRGSLKDLYEKIDADIEKALPLIKDEIYTVPKYHFNEKAAYAFAARFNLYYQKWEKVVTYSSKVLGKDAKTVLRNWPEIISLPSNFETRANAYTNSSSEANLLLNTAISQYAYCAANWIVYERFNHGSAVLSQETLSSQGLWSGLYMLSDMWSPETHNPVAKFYRYFEYLDKAAGTGYTRILTNRFSTNESLLCRAEAYAMLGKYDESAKDITDWVCSVSRRTTDVTKEEVVKFYSGIDEMESTAKRTVKKKITPLGFSFVKDEDNTQENFIHCILHCRRIETIHEGLRWMDIKRWGLEIYHNIDGEDDIVLTAKDPRKAMQLPQDVIFAGLQANPRN